MTQTHATSNASLIERTTQKGFTLSSDEVTRGELETLFSQELRLVGQDRPFAFGIAAASTQDDIGLVQKARRNRQVAISRLAMKRGNGMDCAKRFEQPLLDRKLPFLS